MESDRKEFRFLIRAKGPVLRFDILAAQSRSIKRICMECMFAARIETFDARLWGSPSILGIVVIGMPINKLGMISVHRTAYGHAPAFPISHKTMWTLPRIRSGLFLWLHNKKQSARALSVSEHGRNSLRISFPHTIKLAE
jgi:hypothetical protein